MVQLVGLGVPSVSGAYGESAIDKVLSQDYVSYGQNIAGPPWLRLMAF